MKLKIWHILKCCYSPQPLSGSEYNEYWLILDQENRKLINFSLTLMLTSRNKMKLYYYNVAIKTLLGIVACRYRHDQKTAVRHIHGFSINDQFLTLLPRWSVSWDMTWRAMSGSSIDASSLSPYVTWPPLCFAVEVTLRIALLDGLRHEHNCQGRHAWAHSLFFLFFLMALLYFMNSPGDSYNTSALWVS